MLADSAHGRTEALRQPTRGRSSRSIYLDRHSLKIHVRDEKSCNNEQATGEKKRRMSTAAAWPFAATGASISAVNITVEPAPSDLTFGAAPSTAKGVLCEHIGGASYAWCG